MDTRTIGPRIKELREQLGLKQYELAEKTDVHQTQISEVEAGRRPPSYEYLCSISNYCGVSIDYILTGSDFVNKGLQLPSQEFDSVEYFSQQLKEAIATGIINWEVIRELIRWIDKFSLLKDLERRTAGLGMGEAISKSLKDTTKHVA